MSLDRTNPWTSAVRVALPRGDLRVPLAERLGVVGLDVAGYREGARTYQFAADAVAGVEVRVFSDRDIPIQVAVGQYDLGITSRAGVDELLARHPRESLVLLRPLDVGATRLVIAGPPGTDLARLASTCTLRVATEYPALAERWLNRARVRSYRVLDVWGQPQAWPPDDAEVALLPETDALSEGFEPLVTVHEGSAWVVGNREALAGRDLGAALERLLRLPAGEAGSAFIEPAPLDLNPPTGPRPMRARKAGTLRLAVPDGHAQRHTVAALADAGIAFEGYSESEAVRRPSSVGAGLEHVEVKVMRPQDMARAVALGLFDLALTGRDWLAAHQASFPASPVVELGDLRRSRYDLGAVVSDDVPAATIQDAIAYWRRDDPERVIRVASEYVALADRYARDRHLGRYQVIPINGASEGFVPEDADVLIEGSETGTTLRANRLHMLDVIMVSTNCVIGHRDRPSGEVGALRDEIVRRLVSAAASEGGA
jgi:ATP phosphoribosyltransferase